MKRKFLLNFLVSLICSLGFSISVYAQGTVSGQVNDAETGEGLIGVTVLVKGSNSQCKNT